MLSPKTPTHGTIGIALPSHYYQLVLLLQLSLVLQLSGGNGKNVG
jgi:hypothetical protein